MPARRFRALAGSRRRRPARAAAAGAIAANLALLGYGTSGNDPVGKLRPVAHFPAAPPTSSGRPPDRSNAKAPTTRGST